MIVRPIGIVQKGELVRGLELVLDNGRIAEIRPHTGVPEAFVLSPAFVNAHSHLEYRGHQDRMTACGYWSWLVELTRRKQAEPLEEVERWTVLAAQENRKTGVAFVAEHSDRPTAGRAMAEAGLDGIVFQEAITAAEADAEAKLARVRQAMAVNAAAFRGPVCLNPHAAWTVDAKTLAMFQEGRVSLHVAETEWERQWLTLGTGKIAEALASWGRPVAPTGESPVQFLARLGLARPGAQFVHCCDVDASDIAVMAANGVAVAHCPRSNRRLGCPTAPVREMLDAGILVGLGMDSPASGGPIDMFAEMRACDEAALARGRPLEPEEIWHMATGLGAASLGRSEWEIAVAFTGPMIAIHLPSAISTADLIREGRPPLVEWFRP